MAKKILYSVLTLLSIWFFIDGIPVDIFDANSTLITILGGVITTGLLAASLFQIFPPSSEKMKEEQNLGCFFIFIMVAFFFGFSIFLIFRSSNARENELKEHGIFTTGIVKDGSSFKTRRADFTDLTIEFTLKNGHQYTATADLSASEFNNYGRGQEVAIVYSEEYPSIIRILRNEADIQAYSKQDYRNIKLHDLLHLFELKNYTEINAYLNSINPKWNLENGKDPRAVIYYNSLKNIGIKISENEITYIHSVFDPSLFNEEYATEGFIKSSENGVKSMFSNHHYILLRRNERIKGNNQDEGILGMKNITVISILKK